MRKILFVFLFLFCLAFGERLFISHAQQTIFVPKCSGTNDTAAFSTIISTIGSNTGTIRLPYKSGSRCAVNTLTIPGNVTLDNSDGTGISVNSGQTLTVSSFVGPRKKAFYGSGNVIFGASITVFPEWFGYLDDAILGTDGTTSSNTTFTSATRSCSSTTDPGKSIVLYASGSVSGTTGLNNRLLTTIASCSGSSFVLTSPSLTSVSGTVRFAYGTGSANTTAMQAAASSITSGGTIHITGSSMLGAVTLLSNTTVFAYPNSGTIYSIANSVFTFSSRSNITVDGLRIDACGNPLGNGAVTLIGGTVLANIKVQNCYLTDSFLTSNLAPVATFNRHGVLLRDQVGAWVLNNTFEHALRIKAAGGSVGESKTWIVGNNLLDTNENGISLLTGSATTVRDMYILNNTFDGIMSTGDGIVIGDDGGGGGTQAFINIQIVGNIFKGLLPSNTAYIQDKGSGIERDINISFNIFDNSTGTVESTMMAINKANQGTTGQTINFQAIGNLAYGVYDFAVMRFGNIASGIIDSNQIYPTSNGQRLMRIGAVSNLIISNNLLTNAGTGIYFTDGAASGVEVRGNVITLSGINSSVGIYIDTQSQAFAATIARNTITGAGGVFTNTYGIQDAEAGGGDTSGVTYLDNIITNINTATALGSFKYRTLPSNALVTELPPATVPQLLSLNSSNNSATPDVRGQSVIREAYTTPVTITAINNASPGVPFTIMFTTGNVTIQNNASIKLAGGVDFVATASDSITLVWNGTALQEISRSVN
jgi:hypothetical protein